MRITAFSGRYVPGIVTCGAPVTSVVVNVLTAVAGPLLIPMLYGQNPAGIYFSLRQGVVGRRVCHTSASAGCGDRARRVHPEQLVGSVVGAGRVEARQSCPCLT